LKKKTKKPREGDQMIASKSESERVYQNDKDNCGGKRVERLPNCHTAQTLAGSYRGPRPAREIRGKALFHQIMRGMKARESWAS